MQSGHLWSYSELQQHIGSFWLTNFWAACGIIIQELQKPLLNIKKLLDVIRCISKCRLLAHVYCLVGIWIWIHVHVIHEQSSEPLQDNVWEYHYNMYFSANWLDVPGLYIPDRNHHSQYIWWRTFYKVLSYNHVQSCIYRYWVLWIIHPLSNFDICHFQIQPRFYVVSTV